MDFERKMAALFASEDSARAMARWLMDLAHKNPDAAAAERDSLLAFLRGPLERHFLHEESEVFPLLREQGLGPEVDVAMKQHNALRTESGRLAAAATSAQSAEAVFLVARLMLHHTNFEGDYIYPALSKDEWHKLMARTRGE